MTKPAVVAILGTALVVVHDERSADELAGHAGARASREVTPVLDLERVEHDLGTVV